MFDTLSDSVINCIWSKRSDIAIFYKNNEVNGWPTATVANKKACLTNWWSFSDEARQYGAVSAFVSSLGCTSGSAGGGSSGQPNTLMTFLQGTWMYIVPGAAILYAMTRK